MDDLIAFYHAATPAQILMTGLMAICAIWAIGLSWWLISESEWVWWWFRLSRPERRAWRRFLRR